MTVFVNSHPVTAPTTGHVFASAMRDILDLLTVRKTWQGFLRQLRCHIQHNSLLTNQSHTASIATVKCILEHFTFGLTVPVCLHLPQRIIINKTQLIIIVCYYAGYERY